MRADELISLLASQRAVKGDRALAAALAGAGELVPLQSGTVLLRQEEDGDAIFFLLRGAVRVEVNGRTVARRDAGETVGEMAAIDPRALRAATVVVTEPGTALRVSEPRVAAVADQHPALWRHLAAEMAERLRQSNRLIRSPNPRPEFLVRADDPRAQAALATALQDGGMVARCWPEDAEPETWYPRVFAADFGVLVLAKPGGLPLADYWMGLCSGLLGRGRAFVLTGASGAPSLPGCELVPWDQGRDPDLREAGSALVAAARDLGPR